MSMSTEPPKALLWGDPEKPGGKRRIGAAKIPKGGSYYLVEIVCPKKRKNDRDGSHVIGGRNKKAV